MANNNKLNFDIDSMVEPNDKVDKIIKAMREYCNIIQNIGEKFNLFDVKKNNNYGINCPNDIDVTQNLNKILSDRYDKCHTTIHETLEELITESNRREHIEEMVNLVTENFAQPTENGILKKHYIYYHPNIFANVLYNECEFNLYKAVVNNENDNIKKYFAKNPSKAVFWYKLSKSPNKNNYIVHSYIIKKTLKKNEKYYKLKRTCIFAVIIFMIILIGNIYRQNSIKEKEISEIKNNAYEFLKNKNETNYINELEKLSQYGIKIDNAKNELTSRYNDEKQRIISDIAYNYEHNRNAFKTLKQQYLPILFDDNENKFNEEIEKKLGYKELSLKSSPLPKSGVIHNYTGKKAIAPFEIKTQASDENYYIKLVDPYKNETEIIIFIRGGETKEMNVPIGTYRIKRASGYTWYGEDYLFGHNTQYTTSDELLTFKISGQYVEGHTLTLYKVEDGNFSTKEIGAEDF